MQDHNKRVFRRGLHGSLHHRRFRLEQGRASEESRTGRSLAEAIRLTSSSDSISDVIGRIRLGNFVEHFQFVEHISYSSGTSRNSVEHKRCQEKCL